MNNFLFFQTINDYLQTMRQTKRGEVSKMRMKVKKMKGRERGEKERKGSQLDEGNVRGREE